MHYNGGKVQEDSKFILGRRIGIYLNLKDTHDAAIVESLTAACIPELGEVPLKRGTQKISFFFFSP